MNECYTLSNQQVIDSNIHDYFNKEIQKIQNQTIKIRKDGREKEVIIKDL